MSTALFGSLIVFMTITMMGHIPKHDSDMASDIEVSTQMRRAMDHVNKEEYDIAVDVLSKVIDEKPENTTLVDTYLIRGYCLQKMGRYEDALQDYESVVMHSPTGAEAYHALLESATIIATKEMRYEDALKAINMAIDIIDDDPTAYIVRMRVYMGIDSRLEDVVDDAGKVIELGYDNAYPYFIRGTAYLDLGRLEDALEDLNRAIEMEPLRMLPYAVRALVYYDMGAHDLAQADLQTAIELRPESKFANVVRTYIDNEQGQNRNVLRDVLGEMD